MCTQGSAKEPRGIYSLLVAKINSLGVGGRDRNKKALVALIALEKAIFQLRHRHLGWAKLTPVS